MTDPAVKHLVEVLVEDMRVRTSGGIERFLTRLALDGGRKDYEAWANDPMTRVFLDAVKALADTVPLAEPNDHGGLAKAFGCLSALRLVERLVEDPTRVFPGIYDGAGSLMSRSAGPIGPEESYDTPADTETNPEKED